ncbi:hypothetical protein MNV49_006175 [Pseudohyphozyma bogoriensis]|nr:hypothetical protein MNV49_006175 [Pseudohyphozyma bogoriensis]
MDMGTASSFPSAVWPEGQVYLRPIVLTLYLSACCLMTYFVTNRAGGDVSLKSLSLAKLLVIALLVDSFLFVFTSAIIIFGVGTSYTDISCQVGIWWCIMLYATSKVFIYLFLMERVHLVFCHTASGKVPRWKSPYYRISCGFFAMWVAVGVVMAVGRISFRRTDTDGACVIGLKLYATVPMLTVDALVNLFLTGAFVVPIYRSQFTKARSLARNSSIAAIAALVTSFANIGLLTAEHGKQLSWVCLGSCGLDVTFNASIIYFVTRGGKSDQDIMTATSGSHGVSGRRPSAFPGSYFPGQASDTRPPFQHSMTDPSEEDMPTMLYERQNYTRASQSSRPFGNSGGPFPSAPLPVIFAQTTRTTQVDLLDSETSSGSGDEKARYEKSYV